MRNGGVDTSYGNDYDEIWQMKQLADELNISLLLVHHLRKQGDSDSVVNQKAILTKYADENGFTNIQIFVNDGYSGVSFNRPEIEWLRFENTHEAIIDQAT